MRSHHGSRLPRLPFTAGSTALRLTFWLILVTFAICRLRCVCWLVLSFCDSYGSSRLLPFISFVVPGYTLFVLGYVVVTLFVRYTFYVHVHGYW